MALKLVGKTIWVSMVTNHSYQTHPISIKPPPRCRVSCEEHNGVMFMVGGECNGCILDLKILGGRLSKKVKKVKKVERFERY